MTQGKRTLVCIAALLATWYLSLSVPVVVANDGSQAGNVICVLGVSVLKESCIPENVEVPAEISQPTEIIVKTWGGTKGVPYFLNSAFANGEKPAPVRKKRKQKNPAWGWVKIEGTRTNRQRACNFSPELDMAPLSTSDHNKHDPKFVQLALLYFNKVVCKAVSQKDPGFPKKIIYHLLDENDARLQKIMEKRNYVPLRFAEHMAKPDAARWLKKLHSCAAGKYSLQWSAGYVDKMKSYFHPAGDQERNFRPWALHGGPIGGSLAAVVYETQDHEFQLVDKKGKALEVSEQNKIVRRKGTANLLVSANSALHTGRMNAHQMYQFDGVRGFCFSTELRDDFQRATQKELQGKRDITAVSFDVFEVK